MHGWQLTFYTQQDRRHKGSTLAQWLLNEARKLGIGGATIIAASAGYGRDRRPRSVGFFDLADQPLEITMAVQEADAQRLFQRINEEKLAIFFIKIPIEFGTTGQDG
ncbi:MAG: DUF190 domain-containing protein [Desulfobulbus sp.]|jgi:PII-like signaling protein